MSIIRKIIKNKTIFLGVIAIVICLVYTGIQKAIDKYQFKNDIVLEESKVDELNEQTEFVKEEQKEELDVENVDNVNVEDETSNESNTEEESPGIKDTTERNLENNKIYIYITGEIKIPGVIRLKEGSRIVDAINAAGGTTVKANLSKVNLVYVLEDGMKVNIPSDEDLKNNPNFEYITMNSRDGGNDDYSEENKQNSNSSSTNSGKHKKYEIININTATQTELESLPGIGPSLALKIINYRKENGKFTSIEEIKNVSGIGENKFENLKKYITI